jgi:hypothetical protein
MGPLRYKGASHAIIGGITMTRAFGLIAVCLVPLLVPVLVGSPATAQDDEEAAFDRTPRDCVVTNTIDQTDVIDDQNIIFHMNGRRAYRNHLPRKCPGLERENRFSYETRSSRLCSIDTITVLEQFGVGFRPGFTCRLGEFVPLSPAEIEDLELQQDEERSGRRGRAAQSTIETRPVELENETDAADGDADAATDEAQAPDEAGDAEN